MIKRIISLVMLTNLIIFSGGLAHAASPKAGAACSPKDARVKIGGVYFHCAVIASKWSTSTQLVWQNEEQWSASVDKVFQPMDVKTKYQYCLTDHGAPLPGKKGAIPDAALTACEYWKRKLDPSSANSSNGSSSTTANQGGSAFPPYITASFLACLKNNGLTPKDMTDLLNNVHGSAAKACKDLAPDFLARSIG